MRQTFAYFKVIFSGPLFPNSYFKTENDANTITTKGSEKYLFQKESGSL